MHVPAEIKVRIENEIKRCIDIAERRFNRSFQFPTIVYEKKGTTAGTARDGSQIINLNPILLMENVDAFIKRTVPHEFAHIVDGIVYPQTRERKHIGWKRSGRPHFTKRSLHGRTWKSIMHLFGADASRCHSYDTTNAKTKKVASHVYTCRTCEKEMMLGPKRHRKMQIGIRYWMRGCQHHAGYDYVGLEGQRKAPVPVAPSKPTLPTPSVRPAAPATKTTKLDDAVTIVRNYSQLDRKSLIALIALTCGMSQGYAQTLYYQAKKVG